MTTLDTRARQHRRAGPRSLHAATPPHLVRETLAVTATLTRRGIIARSPDGLQAWLEQVAYAICRAADRPGDATWVARTARYAVAATIAEPRISGPADAERIAAALARADSLAPSLQTSRLHTAIANLDAHLHPRRTPERSQQP